VAVHQVLRYFEPQPDGDDLPRRLPSPFAGSPHPIARRAASALQDELAAGWPWPRAAFAAPERGKMFGVLVVRDAGGRIGHLRGFSGMVAGRWEHDGFVGPVFDAGARATFWPEGEAELVAYDRRLEALAERARHLERAQAAAEEARRGVLAELGLRHAENRRRRHAARSRLGDGERPPLPDSPGSPGSHDEREPEPRAGAAEELRELVRASRTDAAELRRLRQALRVEREQGARPLHALDSERRALKAAQVARSSELLERIQDGYRLVSFRGQPSSLRDLFAPEAPPGGAGDCAAPKLLAHAARQGLAPLALAEFWWGDAPATGGRHHGLYYPACRGKCGPILRHVLDGLECDPLPVFGAGAIPAEEPRTLYEDRWLLIVVKPEGLLSVPGRNPMLDDAVSTRLGRRYPEGRAPMLVHRLDLDTSGLMLVAKDNETYVALQRQFLERAIEKRYAAWLSRPVARAPGAGARAGSGGRPAPSHGFIDLPLRTDVDDRPRQIVDPTHGKAALTEWRLDPRFDDSRRVQLFPRTGRTHQLRVHAAHPLGLAAPILGDRLYGLAGERLFLHAERLAFIHPRTGRRIEVESQPPF